MNKVEVEDLRSHVAIIKDIDLSKHYQIIIPSLQTQDICEPKSLLVYYRSN